MAAEFNAHDPGFRKIENGSTTKFIVRSFGGAPDRNF
jgi:hypothetical protein